MTGVAVMLALAMTASPARPDDRPAPRRVRLSVVPPLTYRSVAMARRAPVTLRCILCGRAGGAEHGAPIDVGGEMMVPVCEQLHPGGIVPYGPPDPVVRSPYELRQRAFRLPGPVARGIAGSLGAPSKLPGASYGLDAKRCLVGSELVKIKDSVCHGCYALKNFYATWWPAKKARHTRQAAIEHPLWPEAMVSLILEYVRDGGEKFFRWHDSGDLQSVEHLERIAGIARATYEVKHWLPTREYAIVAEWIAEGGQVPDNLTIRLSAHFVDCAPDLGDHLEQLLGLPTSTVHSAGAPAIAVSTRRADTVPCRAWTRDNHCGPCRACWSQKVRNVSYPKH